jgi:DNA-binding FadR family transcriptional regulator
VVPSGDALAANMDARRCVDPTLCALAAQRRGAADVVELAQAHGWISTVRAASSGLHRSIRAHRAGNDRLREAIARAARNRYLADASARIHRRLRDAEWATEQGLRSSVESMLEALTDAILRGDPEQASHASQAETDLLESWSWRRLADLRPAR